MFIITFTLPTYPPTHPHILYAYIIFHVQGIFISDMVYIIFIYIYIIYIGICIPLLDAPCDKG